MKKLWSLIRRTEISKLGIFVSLLLLGLIGVNTYFVVLLNRWNGDLYNGLQSLNYDIFINLIKVFLCLISLLIVGSVAQFFTKKYFIFKWRLYLTNFFLNKWMENRLFYKVSGKTENPDQRISEDISYFTDSFMVLFIDVIENTITFITFVGVLWGLSGPITFSVFGKSITIHGYLVWASIIYNLGATWIALKLGKPLIKLDFEQEKKEANFRYKLIRIRENREQIALYNGGEFEKGALQATFESIKKNYYQILTRNIFISSFQVFYVNIPQVLPMILLAPRLFGGAITMGIFMQTVSAFNILRDALSIVIMGIQSIASLSANVVRLDQFLKDMDEAKELKANTIESHGERIELRDFCLYTAEGNRITGPMNLLVNKGERVMVVAPSGYGKTTIARYLKGIWPYASGKSVIPENNIYVVPQQPYMPLGSLRKVMNYPYTQKYTDNRIKHYLEICQLEKLSDKLDEERDWTNYLSLGERQRVAFARCLLEKPEWIILDEPTASLDKNQALYLYSYLKKWDNTIITITHDMILANYHDKVIDLNEQVVEKSEVLV